MNYDLLDPRTIDFFVSRYLIFMIPSVAATMASLHQILSYIGTKKWNLLKRGKKVSILILASAPIGLFAGYAIGHAALATERVGVIDGYYEFKTQIEKQQLLTEADWRDMGFINQYPYNPPYALEIESSEWPSWATRINQTTTRQEYLFVGRQSKSACRAFLMAFFSPKIATFKVRSPDSKTGLAAYASWTGRDLEESYAKIDRCIDSLEDEQRLL